MQIATWNINSLTVRLPQVLAWLAANPVDALCLQELKLTDDKFPFDALKDAGYEAAAFGQKTYNGVAILSRSPLRDVVRAQFDFERIRRECPLKLFIAATAVRTGKVKLFRTAELSEAALLASACLPTLHHAVEIDGEHYWDGGFTANPAIYPLLYECDTADLLMVLLNPLQHAQAPRSAEDIATRSMELGFLTTFLREMRMIAHARQFIAERPRWSPIGRLEHKLLRERFHLIDAPELGDAGSASKLNATASSLLQLRELGRARAETWLQTHAHDAGRRETVDVDTLFL